MSDEDLIALADKHRKDAEELLKRTRLLELLNQYGRAELTGSFVYNLMLSGDIDIHLFGKFDRKDAQNILNKLISETDFTGYMFFDWVGYPSDKFPKGYYIGFKQIMPGYDYQWKIDIWLLKEEREESRRYAEKLSAINREERLEILRQKYIRKKENLMAESTEIYDAVLGKG